MRRGVLLVPLVALALVPAASTLPPGRSTVTLTSSAISVRTADLGPPGRTVGDITVHVGLLYNKGVQAAAFGNSVMHCAFVGAGGVLAGGTSYCHGTYTLPRGRITVTGTVRTRSFYRLAVTGGTGFYADASGELVASTVGQSRELLIFRLKAV